jgi:hypothetical protein
MEGTTQSTTASLALAGRKNKIIIIIIIN